jgi:hypothetical protein
MVFVLFLVHCSPYRHSRRHQFRADCVIDSITMSLMSSDLTPDYTKVPRLLRARRERPRDRRAAEQRDERAPLQSITSSAVASSVGGTVRPNMRAVSALMTSSNLVACTTGKSAGFSPLRMRPA